MTKKQPKYKALDETEFNTIKGIINLLPGKSINSISKMVGRSNPTVLYISKSDNYKAYKDLLASVNSKSKPKPSPEPQTIQVPSEDMAKLFTLLAEISEKLDRVAIPKRKFF